MGMSKWSSASTATYATKNLGRSTASRDEVFTSRGMPPEFDPAKITMRESRDSEANPNSNAIIIGLDVTGSMGEIPEQLARTSLPRLVESLHEYEPVTDPHIMFMAIGDLTCDRAPLQCTQFEADIEMSQQIDTLWLEGRGGGNTFESYDAPWAFAAHKTSIDCFEKRNKKGYIFTIGDELPPRADVQAGRFKERLGIPYQANPTPAESLAGAQEMYDCFHILTGGVGRMRGNREETIRQWDALMGNRAMVCDNLDYLVETIVSIMQVNEGSTATEVLDQWLQSGARETVERALFREGASTQVA